MGDMGNMEPAPALGEEAITWNTHVKLREFFGFSTAPELFDMWLRWFYENCSYEQRRTLRKTELYLLNPEDFPTLPQLT